MNDIQQYVDVPSLPSMLLNERVSFPAIPCVYLVCDINNDIYYVGGTKNLQARWQDHHKLYAFVNLVEPKVCYLTVSPYLVWDVEAFLIRHLRPKFNIRIPEQSDLINRRTLH